MQPFESKILCAFRDNITPRRDITYHDGPIGRQMSFFQKPHTTFRLTVEKSRTGSFYDLSIAAMASLSLTTDKNFNSLGVKPHLSSWHRLNQHGYWEPGDGHKWIFTDPGYLGIFEPKSMQMIHILRTFLHAVDTCLLYRIQNQEGAGPACHQCPQQLACLARR